jgi:signal transduction histidine kinase
VLFVDVFKRTTGSGRVWRGSASIRDLRELVARFLGRNRSQAVFAAYARSRGLVSDEDGSADVEWVRFAERQLAGAIGTASARVMVATVVAEGTPDIDQVMEILDEASQVIEYSRRLEEKSHQLETATQELRAANARLQELDKLKDDFVSTVSHELRTPLTSIRSFSEILHDNPRAEEGQKQEFLAIIIAESERLTRLINDMLDLAKMEAGKLDWYIDDVEPGTVIEQAVAATSTLFGDDKAVALEVDLPERLPTVRADRDRLTQVIVNLLSNAAKFCEHPHGKVTITAVAEPSFLRVSVADNGAGIRPENQSLIFEKFQQASDTLTDKPQGTGLGLPICREIVEYFGGRIWVRSRRGEGSEFSFTVPYAGGLMGAAEVAE